MLEAICHLTAQIVARVSGTIWMKQINTIQQVFSHSLFNDFNGIV